MPITLPIPPEPPPLYSFTSALIVFDSSPNLKRAEELIKQKKIELPPKVGSCSDVKSCSDITRSMTKDTPSANEIFSVPVFFQKLCHVVEAFLSPKVGSCSNVKSGSDITRSMTIDTPSANEIFSVPVFFSEVVSCRRSFFNIPLVEIEINITFSHPRNPLIADLADKLLLK